MSKEFLEKVLEIIKEKPIESGIAINYYIKQQLKNNIVVDYKQYKKKLSMTYHKYIYLPKKNLIY